jgi:DNA polymerase II large subunit
LTSTKKFKKSFCEKTAETLYHVFKKPYTNTNKFEASTSGQATSSSASQAVEPQASQVASVDSASRVVKPLETSQSNLTEYSQLQANEKVSTLARIASNPNSALRALVAAVNINNNQENDPEQPINQWVRGQDRIIHLKNQSVSHRNFAALLLVEFFSEDTLNRENVNVLGRVSKGNEAN